LNTPRGFQKPENTPEIKLSPEAQALFREFRLQAEFELRPGEDLDEIKDWGEKFPGHVARYAGLLHCAKWAGNLVDKKDIVTGHSPTDILLDAETMSSAITLGWYFKKHALAAYGMISSDGKLPLAKKVWGIIARNKLPEFKVSDLWRHHVKGSFSNLEELPPVLATLEDLGYIHRKPTQKQISAGRPPSPTYDVNPLALSLYLFNLLNSDDDSSNERVDPEVGGEL
jgi:hypothetical protein